VPGTNVNIVARQHQSGDRNLVVAKSSRMRDALKFVRKELLGMKVKSSPPIQTGGLLSSLRRSGSVEPG
jgi:hypothetical protein